jgi:similar to stage IV sporulation protein
MQSTFISWLRGYVRIELRGSGCEPLLNQMIEKQFSVWDIRVRQDDRMELLILIRDFFELRPLLKRTGCRVHVQERHGLPFFLDKLGNRKIFVGGIAGFIIALYLLTSLVWQIHVEGNERITADEILRAASQQGIHRFQWKFRLPEADILSRNIQSLLPGTAWVGVDIHGTRITIKIVEATIPDKQPLMNPRNLVASKNALITEILAVKGKSMVQPNTYVRKGDVLISGIIGNEQNSQIVVATGTVKGLVWYTSHIEVPLMKTYKVYSGESIERNYVVFGTRALQLTGYGKQSFANYETIPKRKTLQWRSYSLPIGWLHEKVMEVYEVKEPVNAEEAKSSGLEQARAELLSASGKESRIAGEKILHEKTENGKVYMEVHFEVEELIMEEQPIVTQGE